MLLYWFDFHLALYDLAIHRKTFKRLQYPHDMYPIRLVLICIGSERMYLCFNSNNNILEIEKMSGFEMVFRVLLTFSS